MIYFDKDYKPYSDLVILDKEDVIYTCTNDIWEGYLRGEYVWDNGELVSNPQYDEITAKQYAHELENALYNMKAKKAYGGIIINNLLVFETNQISITNTVASLALMQDGDVTNWKYYTVNNVPEFEVTTKEQLAYIAMFARKMIDDSFAVEGRYNSIVVSATIEQLNSQDFRQELLTNAQHDFDEVNNQLTITLGV